MSVVLVTALVLVAVVSAAAFRLSVGGDPWAQVGYWLILAAAAFTVALAAVVVGPAWADSGAFALLLVGIPLVLAAGSVMAKGTTRLSTAVVWVAALLMLGWALFLGLGSGGFFVGPAIVMLAAATASSLTLEHQSRAVRAQAQLS